MYLNTVRQLDGIDVERVFSDKVSGKDTARRGSTSCRCSSATAQLLSVMGAFAEFERQRESIAEAKHRGVYSYLRTASSADVAA
ncbi:hypothetical protein [Streptomyces sp. NPDC006879]|uniref:hypothetical protein n=1 Tax=Streptomyces sp. NPDC006879 TaxID=3364767 RepID=UPI0036A7F7BD